MEPKSRINRAFLPCYGIKQTLLVKVSRGGCWRDTSGNTIEFLDQSKTIHRRIRKHQVIKLFNWSPWYNIDVGLVTNVKGFYLLFSCFYRFVIYFLFFLFYIYFYFEDGIVKLSFSLHPLVKKNQLISICGNNSDFLFHTFPIYYRRISQERKSISYGIYNGIMWYIFNNSL